MTTSKRRRPKKHRSPSLPSLPSSHEWKPDDLLTDVEAAAYLRVKPHTLRVWRLIQRKPSVPFIRLADSPRAPIRYLFRDLKSFVESLRTQAA